MRKAASSRSSKAATISPDSPAQRRRMSARCWPRRLLSMDPSVTSAPMDDGPNSPKPASARTFQPLAAEQWLFNRYWLARELGGAVWLAEDRRLERWVALKFLSP